MSVRATHGRRKCGPYRGRRKCGPYRGRGRVYDAHAPAPFMGEGSRTISESIF